MTYDPDQISIPILVVTIRWMMYLRRVWNGPANTVMDSVS